MEPRDYVFHKSTLTVKFGNIIDTNAEVIVSSDDCLISMRGGVSKEILKAGGETIKTDAHKMVPLSLGDVIVTTAGKLEQQKYVFHSISIDKNKPMNNFIHQIAEEDILNHFLQRIVDKCFTLMKSIGITSIAFPLIGAGFAKIPVKNVIELMADAIARNLAKTNKSLTVELYLYDIYKLYSESDYITLFETLAVKSALIGYKQPLNEVDEPTSAIAVDNDEIQVLDKANMKHKVFKIYMLMDSCWMSKVSELFL